MHDKLISYLECIKVWLVLVHRSDQKFRATDSAIWLGLIVSCAVKSFGQIPGGGERTSWFFYGLPIYSNLLAALYYFDRSLISVLL